MSDLRLALRQLLKAPAFTVVSVLTLGLGIGANTAMFSVVNGVLLKPLPYEDAGRLVQVWEAPHPEGQNSVSPGVFLDWRNSSASFEDLAAVSNAALNLSGDGEPERLTGLRMSANGLRILRARPVAGRTFDPGEDERGKDKVVVLGHGLWERRFGGDPAVVGRAVRLNGESYTVIGILPRGFLPWDKVDFVAPYAFEPKQADVRDNHYLRVIGRLRAGIGPEQAGAELATVSERFKPLYPDWKRDWGVTVVPMQEQMTGELRPTLLVLLGAVGLVLLLACANVANLQLARASARQKEIAVRLALGAGRWRIARQLLTESVLLSLLGATLGIALAWAGVAGLGGLTAANLPRLQEVTLDLRVLAFAVALSVLTGVAFGLAPALASSRPDLNSTLKESGRGSVAGARNRVRSGLVVSEVALALVLLMGAGLLVNSLVRLLDVPPGFDPKDTLAVSLSLPLQKYPEYAQRAEVFARILGRIEALPGVEAAGFTGTLPLASNPPDRLFTIAGRSDAPVGGYDADFDFCSPGYFRAMGIPLRRGRLLDERDRPGSTPVVVVNEAFVREHFADQEPIGQRIMEHQDAWEIVGVVGDVRFRGLDARVQPMDYKPLPFRGAGPSGHIVVRTTVPPRTLAEAVRKAVLEVDPEQPVANVQTLEDVVGASVARRRLILNLLAGFAAAALLLAGIGLHGVVGFAVSQRTRAIGVRMALGADRRHVVGLVLGQGARLAALGLVLGLAGALALTRVMRSLLYDVAPTDPLTLAAVSLVLAVVALLASWLPARRAARVDPMTSLRTE